MTKFKFKSKFRKKNITFAKKKKPITLSLFKGIQIEGTFEL